LTFLQKIKEIIAHFKTKNDIAFPYSEDYNEKREQIWTNLQKGILLEDTKVLIPWSTSFWSLDMYAEKQLNSGDRTNWYLGNHVILDGYSCHIEVMKWSFIPGWKRFSRIDAWLGRNSDGNNSFHFLHKKLTDLLGPPVQADLQKFGDLDLGEIKWKKNKVEITLVGIEVFECKYWLHVGLATRKKY
jgi:hypothetical protein